MEPDDVSRTVRDEIWVWPIVEAWIYVEFVPSTMPVVGILYEPMRSLEQLFVIAGTSTAVPSNLRLAGINVQ
jgi:hypothetical protein